MPEIVTEVPIGPEVGLKLVMLGVGTVTINPKVPLGCPPTVTMTLPVVAPLGTGTEILVALQLVGVADVPLKVTMLVPCEPPKFVPVIVTEVPTTPEMGFKLVILGAGTPTAHETPLLAWP